MSRCLGKWLKTLTWICTHIEQVVLPWPKLRPNWFGIFCISQLTHKQTDSHGWKHHLLGEGDKRSGSNIILQYEEEQRHQVVYGKKYCPFSWLGTSLWNLLSSCQLFNSCASSVFPAEDVLLKVRYEYTSPPDMLQSKRWKQWTAEPRETNLSTPTQSDWQCVHRDNFEKYNNRRIWLLVTDNTLTKLICRENVWVCSCEPRTTNASFLIGHITYSFQL